MVILLEKSANFLCKPSANYLISLQFISINYLYFFILDNY